MKGPEEKINTPDKEDFQRVIQASCEISEIKDLDILLESILLEARRFTGADAGSIYIRRNEHLEISYSQNDTLSHKSASHGNLVYSTFCIPLNNNTIAGYVGSSGKMVNIKDVYNIRETEVPCSFNPRYDKIAGYRTCSMLVFPLKDHRGKIIGVLQLINALDSTGHITTFSKWHESMALNFAHNASTAIERAMLTRSMIMRMIEMAELRDPQETGAHVNRVGAYSVELYERWVNANKGLGENIKSEMDILRMAAMLHDVGKIAITDTILKKPGRLTDREYEAMKDHTWMGARLFLDRWSEMDEAAFDIALNHHKRWDGKGYPGHIDVKTALPIQGKEAADGKAVGKKGEEIPLFARIVSVADVFDALSSKRSYKDAWKEDKVLKIMQEESGKQFDPEIIKVMMASLDNLHMISARYPD